MLLHKKQTENGSAPCFPWVLVREHQGIFFLDLFYPRTTCIKYKLICPEQINILPTGRETSRPLGEALLLNVPTLERINED